MPAVRSGFAFVLLLMAAGLVLSPKSASAERKPYLWVTNSAGDDAHVFDVGTLKLVKHLKVGPNPHGISATADGQTIHFALEDFRSKNGSLVWLDTGTWKITHQVEVGPQPNECECTPDGRWIYVPCADGQYWIVDGREHAVVKKINTGGRPHNTVISPNGQRMYLSPLGSPKKVTIVDIAADHKVLGEIPFDNVVRPPAISKDEKLFFQNIDNLLGFQVADIAARKVIRTVKHHIPEEKQNIPSRCHGLGIRPDQKEIWSCNVMQNLVHVHEMTSGNYEEIAAIPMVGNIYWVCFSDDSKYCFVSVRSEKKIAVVDCETKQIVAHLDVGNVPKRSQVIWIEESSFPEAARD